MRRNHFLRPGNASLRWLQNWLSIRQTAKAGHRLFGAGDLSGTDTKRRGCWPVILSERYIFLILPGLPRPCGYAQEECRFPAGGRVSQEWLHGSRSIGVGGLGRTAV